MPHNATVECAVKAAFHIAEFSTVLMAIDSTFGRSITAAVEMPYLATVE